MPAALSKNSSGTHEKEVTCHTLSKLERLLPNMHLRASWKASTLTALRFELPEKETFTVNTLKFLFVTGIASVCSSLHIFHLQGSVWPNTSALELEP